MSEYIKFWLAKELVPVFLVIGLLALLIGGAFIYFYAQALWRKFRGAR